MHRTVVPLLQFLNALNVNNWYIWNNTVLFFSWVAGSTQSVMSVECIISSLLLSPTNVRNNIYMWLLVEKNIACYLKKNMSYRFCLSLELEWWYHCSAKLSYLLYYCNIDYTLPTSSVVTKKSIFENCITTVRFDR